MVQVKKNSYVDADGNLQVEAWQKQVSQRLPHLPQSLLKQACFLCQIAGEHVPTPSGQSCLYLGLAIAELLCDVYPEHTTLLAALLYHCVQYGDLSLDIIREQIGEETAKLIAGVSSMQALNSMQSFNHGSAHLENVRMMLLAMVEDIRVVLIKLAEQVINLRVASILAPEQKKHIAEETLQIYAPLANRLGIYQMKWELEDLAFRYTEPEIYKKIAKLLDQKRLDREQYVENIVATLQSALSEQGLKGFEVNGRAKHIYSIYRKMQRKKVNYDHIYDTFAFRVLVPSIEDCYTVLSIVHTQWPQIPEEFDDYIASPKANGYRSIHTAVTGPTGKNIEVQIRTFVMHQECEIGVAAHWVYKEGNLQKPAFESKIQWLREVLAWQQELSKAGPALDETPATLFNDRVYVFTPKNQVVDLPKGATVLDFAYHIHTEIGHRCRGAKVNGSIVNLTYNLKTGDRIEILTTKEAKPSRDWLNSHLGYLFTSRAKAKAHHWFKQQDYELHVATGESMLDQECKRLGLEHFDREQLLKQLHLKSLADLYAGLGSGDLRLAQVISPIREQLSVSQKESELPAERKPVTRIKPKSSSSEIQIQGIGNLLTHFAKCCKPIPGDAIIGYITQGRGVSIHRNDCKNIINATSKQLPKIIEVDWGETEQNNYPVNLTILAYDRRGLLRDLTNLFANEKVNIRSIQSQTEQSDNIVHLNVTVEISDLAMLSRLIDRLYHLKNVYEVRRIN